MSTTAVSSVPSNGSLAPKNAQLAPVVIDCDFETVLTAAPRQRKVLWLMVALVVSMVGGLLAAQVDIIITATGKLATSDSEIVVQPLETSIVRSVLVKVGQKVKKDEVLAKLDPTFAQADEAELSAKLRGLQAAYDRLLAESQGAVFAPTNATPEQLNQLDIWQKRQQEYAARVNAADRKIQQFEADLAAHKAEAEGLAEQIKLAGDANGIYESLVASNLASRLRVIETRDRLVQAKSRLSTNLGEQQRLTKQIAETEAERDGFVSEWGRKLAEELAKTRSDRDGAAAQLSKAQLRRRLSVLRAPRDAIVLEVADRPEGSVVREAEPLIRLVPADAPIVADVQIDTRDVARLHVGDRVVVKFEALPWQQFGVVHGDLKSITPDALLDENPHQAGGGTETTGPRTAAGGVTIHYRGEVELAEPKLRNLPPDFAFRPGMRVVADIKIGHRSVLEYILNPVTRIISESLREP